jgi:hypothetical protein
VRPSRRAPLTPFVDALPLPRRIPADQHGRELTVPIRAATHRCHRDLPTSRVWAYDGRVPGATIEAERGRPVRLGVPVSSRGGAGNDRAGQFDQRHRVAGRLGEHLPTGTAVERVGLLVEQQVGLQQCQRLQVQLGKARSKPAGGALPRTPSSTTGSLSRRWPAKASASSELRSSQWASSTTTSTPDASDRSDSRVSTAMPISSRSGTTGSSASPSAPSSALA